MSEWIVPVSDDIVAVLSEDFCAGPLIDDTGRRRLEEARVDDLNGLKIEIFSNEHPPPHFRVSYQGQSADFEICTGESLTGGLEKWRRNIRTWHAKNRQKLISEWNRRRPSDCPVGPVKCES